jgi:hypothetical protein
MNNFWKGFFNIFNLFPSSKSYDEISEELDNKMQDLYDKMGWGTYKSPLNNSWSVATEITKQYEKEQTEVYSTADEFLQEMIKLVPKDKFVPYSHYNKDRDAIQVYWSNDDSYTVPVGNGSINLKISFKSKEVIGLDILNANQLILENRKPLSLDEKQRFAIWWCLDRIVRRYGDKPIIVNGININETIQQLTGRLFV